MHVMIRPIRLLLLLLASSSTPHLVRGQCSAGTYASSTTSSSPCLPCPTGFTSDPGATSCWAQCPAGQVPDFNTDGGRAALSYCMPCAPGTFSPGGVSSCTLCNPTDPTSMTTEPFGGAISSSSCAPICLTGYSNIALGKSATASSSLTAWGLPWPPANAVDGVLGCNSIACSNQSWAWFSAGSVVTSWWQVDLGSSYLVSSIFIWQRTDCEWGSCSGRLSNLTLTVGSSSDGSQNAVCSSQPKAWNGVLGINLTCTCPLLGRYVRIINTGVGGGFSEVSICGALAPPPGYIGCYSDNPIPNMSPLTLASPGQPTLVARTSPYCLISGSGSPSLTISTCQKLAQQAGLPYFSLQNSQECYGAYDLAMAKGNGPSSSCNMPCTGNASQVCGGAWANSLYEASNSTYLGCWTDGVTSCCDSDITNRRVTHILFRVSGDNSVGICNFFALTRGFAFFSLQNSYTCLGTNDVSMALSAGPSSACNMACTGNPSQMCGGPYANSVYRTYTPPPPTPGAILCPISSGCMGFDLTPEVDGVCGTGPSSYNPSCVNCPFGTSSMNGSTTCWQNFVPSSSPGALVSSLSGRNLNFALASDVNLIVNGSYANGAWVSPEPHWCPISDDLDALCTHRSIGIMIWAA